MLKRITGFVMTALMASVLGWAEVGQSEAQGLTKHFPGKSRWQMRECSANRAAQRHGAQERVWGETRRRDEWLSDMSYEFPGITASRIPAAEKTGSHFKMAKRLMPSTVASGPAIACSPQVMNAILDDFQVNENSGSCDHLFPRAAMGANGHTATVWMDERDGGLDIYAQLYTPAGHLQGNNFKVNDDAGLYVHKFPSVAVDPMGNCIFVWQDRRNGDTDIYAQRIGNNGVRLGDNFRVNDDVAGNRQENPAVAVDVNGHFIIVWDDDRTGNDDIFAQRFTKAGEKIFGNFPVSDDTRPNHQNMPAVRIANDGAVVMVWQDLREGSWDIYAQRYSDSGQKAGANFRVNDDTGLRDQTYPSLGLDDAGAFAIAWQDERFGDADVYVQQFTRSGDKIGQNRRINDETVAGWQGKPALHRSGAGDFVVCWEDDRHVRTTIYAQRFDAQGETSGGNFKVLDQEQAFTEKNPAIAMDRDGRFLIVWQGVQEAHYEIYGQRYSSNGARTGAAFRINDDAGSSWQENPGLAADAAGNFVIVWEDERNGNTDIYGRWYNHLGQSWGPDIRINDDRGAHWQGSPAVAVDANGSAIVVWQDGRNDHDDIYAQRFDYPGGKSGGNFKVNDDAGEYWQGTPAIAMDHSGRVTMVWGDDRNNTWDIYAQRYSPLGAKEGANFRVNDDELGKCWHYSPAVGADSSGTVVIVWGDERNGNEDIYAMRFARSGEKLGANFKVNDDAIGGNQNYPAVAVTPAGSFLVVWEDNRKDPADVDIYAQKFAAPGIKEGANFRINDDETDALQWNPCVAVDAAGNTIVAWQDFRSGQTDLFAQRYTGTLQKIKNNSRVSNDSRPSPRARPHAVMTNGQILYAWQDARMQGQAWDIYAKKEEFGVKPVIQQAWVSDITPISANINVQIQADYLNTEIRIRYGKNGLTQEVSVDTLDGVAKTACTLMLDWLWPNHEYHYQIVATNRFGATETAEMTFRTIMVTSVSRREDSAPLLTTYELSPNYPNPFNPLTRIPYHVPERSEVSLAIYNLNGQVINRLAEGIHEPGRYECVWNGRNMAGHSVPSGLYIVRMEAHKNTLVRKLILAK